MFPQHFVSQFLGCCRVIRQPLRLQCEPNFSSSHHHQSIWSLHPGDRHIEAPKGVKARAQVPEHHRALELSRLARVNRNGPGKACGAGYRRKGQSRGIAKLVHNIAVVFPHRANGHENSIKNACGLVVGSNQPSPREELEGLCNFRAALAFFLSGWLHKRHTSLRLLGSVLLNRRFLA